MPSSNAEENELLRQVFDEHASALWRFAVGLVNGDRSRAEDVVQETMLRACRHPEVLDQSSSSARGWLFTVARRIIIDDWRSTRRRYEVPSADVPEVAQPDRTEQAASRDLVVTALGRLSAEHRRVLLECYVRGSSVSEAALRLGVPTGTVKSRTHYALRAFKLAVEELGGTP